ncbi:MAG: hypothetical protein QME51_02980 [Planctomycetota bacterium]|nr:hypothetical protein [Planctomycetota bacterium]MDI6787317.1 hypothetical protein [Planctomycetota bacterium]
MLEIIPPCETDFSEGVNENMTNQKPKPIPLAMLICDTIIDDRLSAKKSLIGIFNNIGSNEMPCRHQTLYVYCVLTEGIGQYESALRCSHLESGKNVFNLTGPIKFPNPLATIEFIFDMKNIVFQEEGVYVFELFCDNQPVISRKINVTKIKSPEPRT